MGFETPEEGYLAKILVPAGSKNVPIGKLVCIIVSNEESVAAFKDFKDDTVASPIAPAAPAAPASPTPAPPTPAAPTPTATPPPTKITPGERVYASPLAKKIAAEKGLSLEVILHC